MLEFSDAPYQFFGAKPSRPLISLARWVNGNFIVPGNGHLIKEIQIEGALDEIQEAQKSGDHLVFVINHPSHSDPQIVTEIHRRLGISSCFMAAYDVFLRGRCRAWSMQKLGNFSIDREGSDRKAMGAAIGVIKEGSYALNIFSEGNVYLTNDRVTPFMDGAAFIALKAQKAMKEKQVKIIPLSLKYTHLTSPHDTVTQRLKQLGEDSGHRYEPGIQPVAAVIGLGAHLITDLLRANGYQDNISIAPDSVFEPLIEFTKHLVSDVETALDTTSRNEELLVDRIRKIRSTIHQIRTDDSDTGTHPEINGLTEKAILALRIHGYLTPYLSDHPTVDRIDETVERIAEDFYSRAMPRTGPRRAVALLNAPIDVQACLDQAGGKLRNAVSSLTSILETTVQSGIDSINQVNDAPGAALAEESSKP